MNNDLRKKLAAEALGTFCLVLAGTSAIVANENGAVTHVGIALTFGLVVFAMISALGDVSGAHLNPAVTIGFCLARRFSGRAVAPYVLCQCAGAVVASACVQFLFPHSNSLGATLPAGPIYQSLLMEILLTALLMFVILSVSTGASEKGVTAGLAIGGTVALDALFGGPVSGASMNPARSLGPALVSWHFSALWLYISAPVVGTALAVYSCRCVRDNRCCRDATLGACK